MTRITAHSGCDQMPDNSKEFLIYAFSQGVDNVEVDVQKTQDNRLVLSHDLADNQAIDLSYAFELLKSHPDKKLNCDLKNAGLELRVRDMAKQAGCLSQVIFSGTVDPSLICYGNNQLSDVEIHFNPENLESSLSIHYQEQGMTKRVEDEFLAVLKRLIDYDIHCINIHFGLCTDLILQELDHLNIACSVWTVDDEKKQTFFLRESFYNMTTRKVKQALKIREELAL